VCCSSCETSSRHGLTRSTVDFHGKQASPIFQPSASRIYVTGLRYFQLPCKMDSLTALVAWPTAPFTESLVRKALTTIDITPSITSSVPNSFTNLLQWSSYDEIDHELTHMHRETVLSSSYTFRKALIRKHFLSRCIHSYLTKHGDSPLKNAVPQYVLPRSSLIA
jgi:hypothetical protein